MEQNINIRLDRKPIFDAMRTLLGRCFTQSEAESIDAAIERAISLSQGTGASGRLGRLSEKFESGGRGPGTVSSGHSDPGGVSYGIYQLASRSGTAARFVASDGARWSHEFANATSGSTAFSRCWRAIANREPKAFADAQHAFIERTHYRPAVSAVHEQTRLDLDSRHPAVRDVTWSVAVQHGGAVRILSGAVAKTDKKLGRSDPGYDRELVEMIYGERTQYVLRIAGRAGPRAGRTLRSITRNRYPSELASAIAMFATAEAQA